MAKPKIEATLDSEAERKMFSEIARQNGMSSSEMIRRYVRDTIAETSYRAEAEQMAHDASEHADEDVTRRRRARDVRRWDAEDRAGQAG